MNLYKTNTTLNEEGLKEIAKHLPSPKFKVVIILVTLCYIIGAIILQSVILAIFSFVFVGLYYYIINKTIKVNLRRFQESTNQSECKYTTSFNETGFEILNHGTNATYLIHFKNITRFVETENFFVMITKTSQFGLVNKHSIEDKEDFVNFLKTHIK